MLPRWETNTLGKPPSEFDILRIVCGGSHICFTKDWQGGSEQHGELIPSVRRDTLRCKSKQEHGHTNCEVRSPPI